MMSFLGIRTPFPPMGTPTQWLISRWMRITRSTLKMLGIYKKSNKLILIRVGKSHLLPILPKMMDGMSGRSKKGSWWVTMS
jgi:hypothetical protein